jgi:predicted nucleic acid-binding protein
MMSWFADTAGWAAWLSKREPFHSLEVSSVAQARRDGRRLVTTNYVLNELTALLTSPLRVPRGQQIQLLTDLRAATWVDIFHIDSALDSAAWALRMSRPDKDWSLVDCASFVVMQRQGLTDSLTADHHFEQAGFIEIVATETHTVYGCEEPRSA